MTRSGRKGSGGYGPGTPGRKGGISNHTTPPSPTRTPHRTYLSQRNRSSITRGAVGHSIPLVEGRRALRGAKAEPERSATRAWGMSGPVRIQEQNRRRDNSRFSGARGFGAGPVWDIFPGIIPFLINFEWYWYWYLNVVQL